MAGCHTVPRQIFDKRKKEEDLVASIVHDPIAALVELEVWLEENVSPEAAEVASDIGDHSPHPLRQFDIKFYEPPLNLF